MRVYWEFFVTFLKIGLFTIGGGYAMIPLIEDEIINKRQWLSKEDFIDLLAISQSAPGVFAVNISIFIGYKLKKLPGALATTLGSVLPSFLIILIIAIYLQDFKDYEMVEKAFKGIRSGVVALIAAPTFNMAKSININRYNVWIPVVSALLIWLLGFSPIGIILIAGISGFIWGKWKKKNDSTPNDIN